nr:hypothetical protein ['Fragaria x ananassa' phyllody phytoplasma]
MIQLADIAITMRNRKIKK